MALVKFLRLLRTHQQAALLGLLSSWCASLASIGLMATAGWFLTAMGAASAFGILLNLFVPSALIRLLAILRTALRYADRLLSHQAAFLIMEKLRTTLFSAALQLDHYAQLRFAQADLERRLHSDIEKLELAFIRQFEPSVCAFLSGALVSAVLAYFSLSLVLCFALCYAAAGVLFPALAAIWGQQLNLQLSRAETRLHNQTADFIRGLFDVTVLGMLPHRLALLTDLAADIARLRARLTFLEGLTSALLIVMSALCFLGIILTAGDLYLSANISAAQTMMLAIGALACFEGLQPLSAALLSLPETAQAAARIDELAQGAKRQQGTQQLAGRLKRITCQQLCLQPDATSAPLLTDFNFTFRAECNYAIQGPLGSGKSTLLHALCGLIPPQGGTIVYNDIAGQELSPESLHRELTLCLQEPCFISGSVREMFTIIKPGCSEDAIKSALSEVELLDFILGLDGSLDAYVGREGQSLSGGQARRLALALALFKATTFLLLDEPGEGLDAAQEERILTRILNSRRGVIMVSHRAAGLNLCDNVLRFERLES